MAVGRASKGRCQHTLGRDPATHATHTAMASNCSYTMLPQSLPVGCARSSSTQVSHPLGRPDAPAALEAPAA